MRNFIHEFKQFAFRGNVIDLAIGVIIGAAFQKIINSLVNDVISPLIGLFVNTDFNYLVLTIRNVDIKYGSFITAIINFLIMALIIFIMIKMIDDFNAKVGLEKDKEVNPDIKKCPYCCTDIDVNATKCPNCTSDLSGPKV